MRVGEMAGNRFSPRNLGGDFIKLHRHAAEILMSMSMGENITLYLMA